MSQKHIIDQMSDDELYQSLIFSQFILFSLAITLSIFLFEQMSHWLELFIFDFEQIFYYGCLAGLLIVFIDLLLMSILPKKYFDDGGINERIFKNRSILQIFIIAFIVAVSEELLFRGIIQTVFGYFIASTLFALVHIRYLRKPVLLVSVFLISFYLGYLYKITGNLFVTIVAHFLVDFLLGLMIRYNLHEVISR